MEESDNATYLTQRLRTLQPESYELELGRVRKRARRAGFALGILSTVTVAAGALAGFQYFAPGALGVLLAVLN